MSALLVLADHVDGVVSRGTLELLTRARDLGAPTAVACGPGAETAVPALREYGAATVVVAADDAFERHPVGPVVALLAALVGDRGPSGVLVVATAEGKEVAGRLAVRTDAGLLTDVVCVHDDLSCDQLVLGGSTRVRSRVTRGVPVIAVRPNSWPAVAAPGAPGPADIERVDVSALATDLLATVTARSREPARDRPELTDAAIVVAAGRGVGGPEGIALVERLADRLNAAIGASRAVTDAGWCPSSYQVGQTGRTVSPDLYLALGISGAIQHRAGMQTAKSVVVVNSDPEAPLFALADFGVVGDLFTVVEQLLEELDRPPG